MSKYWSHNLNNAPIGGYAAAEPRYVSERGNSPVPEVSEYPTNRRERRLAARVLRREMNTSHEEMLGNLDLPIADKRAEIVEAIRDHQVTIIVSETGSGKSTQVVQYILDDLDRDVTLTQPRRIAARNIAQRVDEEIVVKRPGMYGMTAIHTAEKDTRTERTRITVCTDGLRYVKQLHDEGELLDEVLVIDEVHEWNTNIEMLTAWTRDLLKDNPRMRVVLMSATVNAAEVANFYADVTAAIPPIIEVEGRTFAVDKREKPDSTVAEELVSDDAKEKNILCFLPGKREIKDTMNAVQLLLKKRGAQYMPALIPLHSKLSEAEQDRAFQTYPNGKIIFSTDVAQTSLTIPDIDMVVDCGLVRQKQIDDEGSESLPLVEISQDDCDQRAGRAGRVKDGVYKLTRLDKEHQFVPYISRTKHGTPEILRTDVDRNVLHFASIGIDMEQVTMLHAVKKEVIERSKRALKMIGALHDNGTITPQGRRMERISLHPMYARMVIEAEQYSPATQAQVIALATASDVGGLKYYAPDSKKRWEGLSDETESDLIAQLDLFIASREMTVGSRKLYDLDVKNVDRAIEQYEKITRHMHIDPAILSNPNDKERENIKRCIYAGMIDHVYRRAGQDEYLRINGQAQTLRAISNRSVLKGEPLLLTGTPYVYESHEGGELVEKHILENVTRINSPQVLAEIALHLCTWNTEGKTLRGGRLMDVQSLEFRGVPIGVTQEAQASPSDAARDYMIRHVMENPGSALRELYAIEARLKELRRLSRYAPKSIQAEIRSIVERAVGEGDLDESYVDYRIREQGVTLDDYITDEQVKAIERSSPSEITCYGRDFRISYEAGDPLIKRYDLAAAAQLPGEVVLEDGRVVKFVGEHGKRFTVQQLRVRS